MKVQEKSIGELLLQAGKLIPSQIQTALAEQARTREPFGKILVRLGFIQEMDILLVLEGMLALTIENRGELFGIETFRVLEVLKYLPLWPVPLAVPPLMGVTSLRGEILPVLSFQNILGLGDLSQAEETWYVVLQYRGKPYILWVERVLEVTRFTTDQILSLPTYLFGTRPDLFYCLGKVNSKLYSIINPDKLMNDQIFNLIPNEVANVAPA